MVNRQMSVDLITALKITYLLVFSPLFIVSSFTSFVIDSKRCNRVVRLRPEYLLQC